MYRNLSIACLLMYYPMYNGWKSQGVSVAGANPGPQVHPHLGTKGWRHVAVAEPLPSMFQHALPAGRAHLLASA